MQRKLQDEEASKKREAQLKEEQKQKIEAAEKLVEKNEQRQM